MSVQQIIGTAPQNFDETLKNANPSASPSVWHIMTRPLCQYICSAGMGCSTSRLDTAPEVALAIDVCYDRWRSVELRWLQLCVARRAHVQTNACLDTFAVILGTSFTSYSTQTRPVAPWCLPGRWSPCWRSVGCSRW